MIEERSRRADLNQSASSSRSRGRGASRRRRDDERDRAPRPPRWPLRSTISGPGIPRSRTLALLRPKIIKIDRSFVSPTHESTYNDTLLEAIVSPRPKAEHDRARRGDRNPKDSSRHLRALGCEGRPRLPLLACATGWRGGAMLGRKVASLGADAGTADPRRPSSGSEWGDNASTESEDFREIIHLRTRGDAVGTTLSSVLAFVFAYVVARARGDGGWVRRVYRALSAPSRVPGGECRRSGSR